MTRAAATPGGDHAKLFERLFDEGSALGLTESQLVDRFAANRDESAFAALVDRHGPMVLGVCRRFLRDPNDVDDAFQAVFLVLARKAAGLREKELLANWLYGVACRVAVRSRATAARRAISDPGDRLDTDARKPTAVPPAETLARNEDEARLHEEVGRLPTRYRAPVVACYFEGKTHEEAATLLGCPVGTVKGRLARARDLLRSRLERRGVVAPTVLVSATLAATELRAAVPPALAARTVAASLALTASPAAWMTAAALSTPACTLAQGVIQAMFYSHLKLLAIPTLLVGSSLVVGGAILAAPRLDGVATSEKETSPIVKATEKPSAPVRPGEFGREDVLERINQAAMRYRRSIEDAELDGGDAVNDGKAGELQNVLEQHRHRVDQIIKDLQTIVVVDEPSRSLLALLAGFLAREPQINHPDPGRIRRITMDTMVTLNGTYNEFRRAIDWAREDDQAAKNPAIRARAAERYMMRIKMIIEKPSDSMTRDEAASELIKAHANYLMHFVTVDEKTSSKRILTAQEARAKPNADGAPKAEAAVETQPMDRPVVQAEQAQPARKLHSEPIDGGGFGGSGDVADLRKIRQDITGLSAMIGMIDEDSASAAVRSVLDLPASLKAGDGSTLKSFLEQIKGSHLVNGKKIPIYVDPVGLEDAEASLDSPVSIHLEDVPLRFTLRVALKQLGLAYCVRDGVLIISSIEGIQQELLEAEKEMMGLHPDKVIITPNGPTLHGMGHTGGMR